MIEKESAFSVQKVTPILPDLEKNIFHGNSLVSDEDLKEIDCSLNQLVNIIPFNWNDDFNAIIGNPPYVTTQDLHLLTPEPEFEIYKKKYKTSYKQFDKYFIFLERALQKIKENGYVCFIIPNKFIKIDAGSKLRELIAENKYLVSIDDFGANQLFEDKTIYSSIVLLQNKQQHLFQYTNVDSVSNLWLQKPTDRIELKNSILDDKPWKLTSDFEILEILNNIESVSEPLKNFAEIFNGIQTSAERPQPIYWFSEEEIVEETTDIFKIKKNDKIYLIEKSILKPYFKPTKKTEKGLTTYNILSTGKKIIFPYDEQGNLININKMKSDFPNTYNYLLDNYDRLVPKSVSKTGIRDVPNATPDTWYQYGRTQALTAFINTPKLIIKVMAKDNPMYALDCNDMLIASGGTAGYCAISKKLNSQYDLEYIQAWLANPYTERIFKLVGSDFENGFIARGTFVLSELPFVKLDFNNISQKLIYDRVVEASREVYNIIKELVNKPAKQVETTLNHQKNLLIKEIENLITRVYKLDF